MSDYFGIHQQQPQELTDDAEPHVDAPVPMPLPTKLRVACECRDCRLHDGSGCRLRQIRISEGCCSDYMPPARLGD